MDFAANADAAGHTPHRARRPAESGDARRASVPEATVIDSLFLF